MASRTLRLLHVEDSPTQQRILGQYLKAIDDFSFDCSYAASEDAAMRQFDENGADLVLLDYNLEQGNGLNCVRQIRQRDSVVPIIALSGTATPEIAAQLVQAGADDYLGKNGLTKQALADTVRSAVQRSDALRRRAPARQASDRSKLRSSIESLCQTFATACGADLFHALDAVETAARSVHVTPDQMESLFNDACRQLDACRDARDGGSARLMRPLLLELIVRLSEANEAPAERVATSQKQTTT
jgi:DNA-binding response OmpR family regulator